MKGTLIAAILCVVGFLVGCTMSESADEHNRRLRQQAALQMRMLVEDVDAVLLLDRSSSLTDWHTRISK
ncbi:MAG: hypothetical protein MUP47_09960 [Phycisphaerae bacterium]|nr:hypothetical protein [Phycisphaerae bacterium]